MKPMTGERQVVTVCGCTLKIFLVTMGEVLDHILLFPHWKIQYSKITYNGKGHNKQIKFSESKASTAYSATESDSVPRLMRMLFILR